MDRRNDSLYDVSLIDWECFRDTVGADLGHIKMLIKNYILFLLGFKEIII